MVRTESTMLALGTRAPEFSLPDTTGKLVSLADYPKAQALLIAFICNHCPFVKHVQAGFAKLARDYQAKDVAVIAINSNDVVTHPDDSPANMAVEAKAAGYTFPYLFDETQAVAKAYRAACTPDFYVFDKFKKLIYRGHMDGARAGIEVAVTGVDLRAALDAALAGKRAPDKQRASMGCNIKWKSGNEPDYFGG